jgi:citrate synthase
MKTLCDRLNFKQNFCLKLESRVEQWRKEYAELNKQYGDRVISDVKLSQITGGMRGIKGLSCDTSEVPEDKGLIIREYPLKNILHLFPMEIFYLLLTGDIPTKDELDEFSLMVRIRKFVPYYVWEVLKNMPKDSHPMTMLNTAILVMQKESIFAREYAKGARKEDYWKHTLEDALNIIAKFPAIAAAIYRIRYNKGELILPNPDMTLAWDYVYMMGLGINEDEFHEFIRLFLTCHADHEGGNVSAFACATVNSALSDLYYSMSAGLNGLAGPLHGLANQESTIWILETMKKYGGTPTPQQIEEHAIETLNAGQVIPGYGHAVLRVIDPRFDALYNFGMEHCPDDPVFKTVRNVFEVVPGILRKIQKIKDPWPNVDAVSGSLLYHYDIKELSYYTVIFAFARAIGLASQAILNRALGLPITRPKSVTYNWLKNFVEKK